MKTLGEVLSLSVEFLKQQKVTRSRRVAEELLASLLGMQRIELYMLFDRPMNEDELAGYRTLLRRKAKGEPLEYILGEITFFHCKFNITPAVLIPRPETEILLSDIHTLLKEMDLAGKVALDLCCGSGALGIGLKKSLPHLEVILSDLSADALEVAKINAKKNDVEVTFLQGDLLAPFAGKKADFVLCNPPYISEQEYAALDPEVRNFEPRQALVGGVSGVEFYQRLSRELPSFLNTGAKVFFEIGTGQGAAIMNLFEAACWTHKSVKKDWAGHERFFFLEFE